MTNNRKNKKLLSEYFPAIFDEWHHAKNAFSPDSVSVMSNKKVWWKCTEGHEWEAAVSGRTRGTGCPYCSGRKVPTTKSLEVLLPTLADEWHPIKNGELKPGNVSLGSSRKVWWLGPCGHEWDAVIGNRVSQNQGCPFCIGKRVNQENSLGKFHELFKEWHPTKNGDLTPNNVTPGSDKKVWWVCTKGHEWLASVGSRTRGSGCPYCSGKVVLKERSLHEINPSISSEWHPINNKELTPYDIGPFSNKYAWWKCKRGHEWRAKISSRSIGNGCPECSSYLKTSYPEQTIYYLIKKVFVNAINRYNHPCLPNGQEVDIFLPSLNLAIEYDGYYYHSKSQKRDESKNQTLSENKVTLIRVRDNRLPIIKSYGSLVIQDDYSSPNSIKKVINEIIYFIKMNYELTEEEADGLRVIKEIEIVKEKSYILEQMNLLEQINSLGEHQKILMEWHPTKNGSLKPHQFSKQSHIKVWWQCSKGHEWLAPIYRRSSGTGCPYCSGKKVSEENSLAKINPSLAAEWHPIKNGSLWADQVTSKSGKRVWWQCKEGHEWKTDVKSRSKGTACPYCSGHLVSDRNSLETVNPQLSLEWHPTKNGQLKPKEVSFGSTKKVWWECENGHEWEAQICNRHRGTNCPTCSRKRDSNFTQLTLF